MFYRTKDDRMYDCGYYKYKPDCYELENITTEEYNKDTLKYIVDKLGYLVPNPNYEEQKKKQEEERISRLTCTKRVLALALQQLGISYARLKELIATNEQAQLEWDLCVELERSNPLLDILGAQLGLTPTTIDKIFKYANGEIGKEDFDETDIVKGGIANG